MRKLLTTAAMFGVLALTACNRSEDNAASNDIAMDNATTTDDMNGSAMNDTGMTNASLSADEQAFVTEAMKGDNAEVQIGQLAQAQGGSAAVKDFGSMLATDHGAHRGKLADLATSAGMSATDEPSAEGKANLAKLKGLTGAAFDKAFKAAMVEDHKKDIAKYEKQTSAASPALASLAKDTLPVLKKHLSTAQSL